MKKLIIVIAMLLCVATIGAVFALAIFDSTPVTGTITSDDYLFLEMNSDLSNSLELTKGMNVVKTIDIHIRSVNKTNAYLKIYTLSKENKNLSNVKFSLYSSKDCDTLLKDLNGNDCTIQGNGTIIYLIPDNIDTTLTLYLKIQLNSNITESEYEQTGGLLRLSLSENV